MYSNWRATGSLQDYLRAANIVALEGVDTRALTRHLRSAGAMRAAIAPAATAPREVMDRIQSHPRMEGLDLTCGVSTEKAYNVASVGEMKFRVLAYDFGVKRHSLKLLSERGCSITTLPATTTAQEILELDADGFFVSNGPGDPEAVGHALETIRGLAERGVPVFGICLGHQLIGRAFGGSTFKLLYGHRAGNHPVRRMEDGAVEITAQNHGFAVRRGSTPDAVDGAPSLRVTHVNLNEGPHDSRYLFDRFVAAMSLRRGSP
jgi:carbamoyl-phosphate synthase small subunit